MIEFLVMGGYGAYIWPCYLLSFTLLIGVGRSQYKAVKKLRRLTAIKPANDEG